MFPGRGRCILSWLHFGLRKRLSRVRCWGRALHLRIRTAVTIITPVHSEMCASLGLKAFTAKRPEIAGRWNKCYPSLLMCVDRRRHLMRVVSRCNHRASSIRSIWWVPGRRMGTSTFSDQGRTVTKPMGLLVLCRGFLQSSRLFSSTAAAPRLQCIRRSWRLAQIQRRCISSGSMSSMMRSVRRRCGIRLSWSHS